MAEPALKYCAVREGDNEWHLECRFSDGQKYAAIKIDGACPELATRVAALLNGNVWTDNRPTEPGEYWLSLHPSERRRGASKTAWPYQTKIEMGTSELVLTIPSDDGGWFFIALSDSKFLRNAKWSHRETPADPFEEVKT